MADPPVGTPVARVRFQISGMSCASCTRIVEKVLSREPGVEDVHANPMLDAAVVEYDAAKTDEATLRRAIESRTSYRVRKLA